jgi:beta-barrel assembly-enhancing protease
MKKRNKKLYVVILLILIAACSTGINIFNEQDEVGFGLQMDQEIRKDAKQYPIYSGDPYVKEYISKNIFQPIIASPAVTKKNIYNYQLEIIQSDSTLNAFATPGGFVYVYTGLLKYLDSEAALAGVLGHEIAHAERRHATQRMTEMYGFQILTQLVLGSNPSKVGEIVANLFTGLTILANSRANEDESDQFSIKYLQSTKFYPGSVKFFFEKLRDDGKVGQSGQGIGTFLSTHPDPIARITETDKRIKTLGIENKSYKTTGSGMFKEEYKKNILAKLK